jgi:prephenate dehydrogenase
MYNGRAAQPSVPSLQRYRTMQLHRLSIIGVGLLGGSIGMAVKSAVTDCEVIGYGHRQDTLKRAIEVGAIDRGTGGFDAAVEGADLIILCTPVGLLGDMLRGISGFLKPGAIVTDVGSTKASVAAAAVEILRGENPFVGSHPMAGSEKRGVEFARADLYRNALCILTPGDRTPASAVEEVEGFWRLLGMHTCRMLPTDHDRALAEVSHLPHALAAALVTMQSPEAMELAGKGFLDTTRIAGGDGGLWRDIFLDNAPNVRTAIAKLRAQLDAVEQLMEPGKGEELRRWLDAAAGKRQALLQEKLREVTPD